MGASQKKKVLEIEVSALPAKQNSFTFYMFIIKSKELFDICYVSRRDPGKKEGFQRNLSKSRARSIAKYLDEIKKCIPTALIIMFENPVKYDKQKKVLKIPKQPKAALVIDGQHRLYGYEEAESNVDIPVIGFPPLSEEDQVILFRDINSNQKGVSQSLLYDLLSITKDAQFYKMRGHELAEKLNENSDSPFYGKIKMTGVGPGRISQSMLINKLEPLIKDGGGILCFYSLEDQYKIIRNYFQAVKNLFIQDWDAKGSRIGEPLGFGAFLTLFKSVFNLVVQEFGSDLRVEKFQEYLEPCSSFDFSRDSLSGLGGTSGMNHIARELSGLISSHKNKGSSEPSKGLILD